MQTIQTQTISEIRNLFKECSIGGKDLSKKFIELLSKTEISNPLLKAYYAVSLAYKAKTHFNPFKKIEFLKSFSTIMNEAVAESDQNIEVVFLRLMIQKNIPAGLGLSGSIEADRQFLQENSSAIEHNEFDQEFKNFFLKFLEKNNSVKV